MAAQVERHPDGTSWIITDILRREGCPDLPSVWTGVGWAQAVGAAELFKSKAGAKEKLPVVKPIAVVATVTADSVLPFEYGDSHRLSALLSRAEDLIARGKVPATEVVDARYLIDAIRSNSPGRDELAQRLRDLFERAESPKTDYRFSQVMVKLTPDQQNIFSALWEKASLTNREIEQLRGSREVTCDATRNAIGRLIEKIEKMPELKIRITREAGGITLKK